MKYPSKKDELTLSALIIMIIICIWPVFMGPAWDILLFSIPLSIILLWSWFTVGYLILREYLVIHVGPIRLKVPVKEIKIIRKVKNTRLAPALSIDRLLIFYGTQLRMVNISPQNQQKFVSRLISMNPEIEMDPNIFGDYKDV